MKKEILALSLFGALGLYSCQKGNKCEVSVDCNVENILKQEISQEGLEKDLLTLVKHCHEFDKRSSKCDLDIPETDDTDNRISGKCCIGNIYNPEGISLNEGYLFMHHEPCQAPIVIVNGALISGVFKTCNNDPSCLKAVVEQIENIGKRSRNDYFENKIMNYAQASLKRYDHGIKRK